MDCKRMKELIITDYIDGELENSLKKKVEDHLMRCNNCRQLVENLKLNTVEPFKMAHGEEPPESVWQNIRSTIEQWERKKAFVLRPAFAVAGVMIILLIAVMAVRLSYEGRNGVNVYLDEQIEFLSRLGGDVKNGVLDIDLGTSIEEYFL